ncbi:DUF1523 family protein [Roseovarius sp. A21]|uniref:DUF1523 family protein n=1 Tax=Roseovarius bejariae TaxID=2576383 RepID=A0A844CKT3_9RHOB|nr:DUF1523 family protein [Roseovarius bejariae]MRU15931.1 DUF1523 family protein [Roseovarius bejariae]
MVYVKWVFWGLFWLIVAGFLHYSLPQRDIVRIVNTYEERQDVTGWTKMFWAASDQSQERLQSWDVQFIQAIDPDGDPMVYRNEDTGWGWPPYFKFDTANLYTDASDSVSSKAEPEWYAVTHYGWRNEFLSIFPNAVGIKRVAGPDVTLIPWFNIIVLTILAAVAWGIWARWRRFRKNKIEPKIDEWTDGWE